ncbi:MAG: ATP-dependent DNA helicase RecG [Acidobacteriales bacterium 13_2_20CM_2_55_5]|nr:MAG: ATP-dependent DNA helicase RecG [Acidobacteriales bacterium 13_2_20CM_2_55_5]
MLNAKWLLLPSFQMLDLATPVQYVKGIGPRLAEMLAAKDIHTVDELLHYLPFRYEDRLNPKGISELKPGEMASVIAEVRTSGLFRTRRMPIFQMTAGQGRARLKCIWFNATYLRDKFKPGQMVALYGKVEEDSHSDALQLIQPQFEILGDAADDGSTDAAEQKAADSLEIGRIVPIYESAGQGRLTSRWFRRIIRTALDNLTPDIPDLIPQAVRLRLSLVSPREALCQVHWPEAGESFDDLQSSRTPAHVRLIFEELFFLELGLELKRRQQKTKTGIAFSLEGRVREAIKKILPFHPTEAQKRVLKEIASDMEKPSPMRRLLQGDVGSGKTIVAFEAAIIAMENGYQVALMAPTEILAQQHYFSARRILEDAGYRVVLLTGSLEDDRKREIRRHIARGNAQLVIGTHSLIEQKVEFAKLGLVIVDEQHRFGVLQRFKLMKKSSDGEDRKSVLKSGETEGSSAENAEPDVLVMTATPIPRTLALTVYGDLDVSVLDQMPPGRSPIVTRRVSDERSAEVWEFVRKQIAVGHQAYVVYPVIEEKEESELKAAMKMYKELSKRIFPDLRVAVLHGRMEPELKDQVMRLFQKGEIDLLVATTVIEVGVDVANATIMVVEHAERFGLAQLHQLRGRIGRGAAKSYCILMTGGKVSEEGERRLDAMVRTTDGFKIAELDLELRGPGEFFGTRQAGLPSFQVANLIRDRQLLEVAKREAAAVLAGPNPDITQAEISKIVILLTWDDHFRQPRSGVRMQPTAPAAGSVVDEG